MNVTILGRRWRLVRGRLPKDCDGLCDDPATKNKAITVGANLKGERELAVLIHEALHAAGWHIDEGFVTRFAEDVARMLHRLGYRKES